MAAMDAQPEGILYRELSYKIVGLAMEVHNALGFGYLEKVYENAMTVQLKQAGIAFRQQVPTPVYFKGQLVGDYFADLVVEDKIILELKSVDRVIRAHKAQALNYLKATSLRLAIILNFGKEKLENERVVN